MRLTERGQRYVVFDDFLRPEHFEQARNLMGRASLDDTSSVISPALDGPARRSRGMSLSWTLGDIGGGGRPPVFTEIAAVVRAETALFGESGDDWDRLTFTFWEYPAGSRLGWHNDAGRGRRGEYILYLHSDWDISWGGELMLIDRDPGGLRPDGGSPVASVVSAASVASAASAGVSAGRDGERDGYHAGDGRRAVADILRTCEVSPIAVLPRPNRLVLVQADTLHTVRRVDHTAGGNRRCTLTGFAYLDREFKPDHDRGRELARRTILGAIAR